MNKSRPSLLLAIVSASIIAGLFSATIWSSSKVYEIRPQINLPEYQLYPPNTTASFGSACGGFEQYETAAAEKLSAISTNLEAISKKLDSIDSKLVQLSDRLTKIESAVGGLGVTQPQKTIPDNIAATQKAIDQNKTGPVLPAKK
jgi:hypothetical protein